MGSVDQDTRLVHDPLFEIALRRQHAAAAAKISHTCVPRLPTTRLNQSAPEQAERAQALEAD
jgi:hypothetical protein